MFSPIHKLAILFLAAFTPLVSGRDVEHPFRPLLTHQCLKGLLMDTSSGCSWLVRPPGITANCMFKSLTLLLAWTGHTLKGQALSGGHLTLCPHFLQLHPVFIHPLSWMWTSMPCGILSFVIVFLLNINIGAVLCYRCSILK
jgi:hypothetical protein